jgi:hypothetical protein
VTDVAVGDRVFGISDDHAAAAELALLTFRAITRRRSGSLTPPGCRSRSRPRPARWTSSG